MKNQELRTPDSAESASALSPREALNVAHEKELLILKKLPPRIRTADDVQALAGILNDFNEAVTSKREAAKQLPSDKVLQQSLEFQTAFYDEVFEAISASWQETEMEMKPSSEKMRNLNMLSGRLRHIFAGKMLPEIMANVKVPISL